jgi:hypothetical protein
MQTVAESGENPYSNPRGQYSLLTGPGEVPDYWPKLFPAHSKEDHATLRPPPVFPARVTSLVPSQAPLEWPHFMRTSPSADTCVAWVDISDTVSGANAKTLISKYVAFGERNCQIRGAAPRPGSALCARCMKWGHHSSVCRAKGIQCPHFFFFFFLIQVAYISIWTSGVILIVPLPLRTPGRSRTLQYY